MMLIAVNLESILVRWLIKFYARRVERKSGFFKKIVVMCSSKF